MSAPPQVAVTGAFDDPRSRSLRFLQEAARLGEVTVLLWSDEAAARLEGKPPKFPLAERAYFLRALRSVKQVLPVAGAVDALSPPSAPGFNPDLWVVEDSPAAPAQREFCQKHGLSCRVLGGAQLGGFPAFQKSPVPAGPPRKKVVVTGTFDWFHSGHIRFFEEASALGDLYVVVGHDANIRLLKGPGHPLFPQEERHYIVQSIRFVTEALISTGQGWLDADPEIQRVQPDIFAVNEDGHKGGKDEYCRQHGIQYVVLKRAPAPGLPRRSSTVLRGF
ncbi:MAG: adenylyltransferase/cytidyltransferase family protein [Verrucomicrobiota bacterium]|jgi:cytidyltransferase-like protein